MQPHAGKEKTKKTPLKELFVDGDFSENRDEWKQDLQKHCGAVSVESEETDENQRERIQRCDNLGNEHFSEGRVAEISVDLVLQARA